MPTNDIPHRPVTAGPITRGKVQTSRTSHDGRSIQTVPAGLLHGPAHWALVALSRSTQVYCFLPLGNQPEEWKIWIEAIAQMHPGHDGRVGLEDWCAQWRTYYRLCTSQSPLDA